MTSVTFPTAIGGDGSTVSDDDNATTGLRNGGWRTRFIPCFTNLVNIADYMVSYTAQTSTFASPPPMGSTTPNTGKFTTLTTTGNVGVGIASPGGRLDVAGTTTLGTGSGSPIVLRISDLSTGDGGAGTWSTTTDFTQLQFYSADASTPGGANPRYSIGAVMESVAGETSALAFRSWSSGAATERMRLDAGGNLGLGVKPSAWYSSARALDIASFGAIAQNSSGALITTFNAYQGSAGGAGWVYKTTNPAARYECGANGTGVHAWFNAVSGTAGNAISFTQALTLTAAPNLLLGGTSDPGGSNALYIANRGIVPGTPSGGGVIYVEAGALKYKGSSGTITTLGPA